MPSSTSTISVTCRRNRRGTSSSSDQAKGKKGADAQSGERGLTFTARVEYIKNLFSPGGHTTSHHEGERILELFETARPEERRRLFS
ncbi:MAG TPA: hypothetical protein VHV78_17735, partial [Gemmatimonadaceae bacterium]|nr:hypothetical protein [Gemmatimonadaceae bacterium]